MKAVFIKEFGGAENLEIREVPDLAKPTETQVLVKVFAAALNRADLLQRKGLYPAPDGFPNEIPGLEFAGEVAEIGENVKNWKIGQRVFGITGGAAQAEFLLANEGELAEIPANLDFVEAAAVPEAFITAYDALFSQANLQSGEICLIHAVGSGVGLAGLQLAKAFGAKVIGTSRTADKLQKCEEFGLDYGIAMGKSFEGILNEADINSAFTEITNFQTEGKGIDVVLDLVGAKYLQINLESLNQKGRIVLVGTTSGSKAELNLGLVMRKRAHIFGTVLRSRSSQEKADVAKIFADKVLPLFANGILKPNVDRVFDYTEIRQAHEYLESNQSFGKVILKF